MTDETKPEATPEATEAEQATKAKAKAEADAERRAARTARLAELKVQLEAWEDKCLTLWHTIEVRKLDLVIMGDSPRGIFLRDEAKRHLGEYTELKRMHLTGMREYAALEDEDYAERKADDKTLRAWSPAIGGFLGGALASALREKMKSPAVGVGETVGAGETVAPPTEPSGGENPDGEVPPTPPQTA
jgi:hypothetical protein